jgi:hypothetical protein
MKHGILNTLAMVIVSLSLVLTGCSKKEEAKAPPAPSAEQTASTAAINMQDGEWEITMQMDMPGIPKDAMKPHTIKTCLTKDNYVPKADPHQSDCKVEKQEIAGNTVSWSAVCKDSTGKGTITYAGDSFNGNMESTMKMEGKEINTKMTMNGKRIGPCPAK